MKCAKAFSLALPVALLFAVGCGSFYRHLGGPYTKDPKIRLSKEAEHLISAAFSIFSPNEVMADYHLHFFGNGLPQPYSYLRELGSPDLEKPITNIGAIRKGQPPLARPFAIGVLEAASMVERETFDDQFAQRLVELVSNYGIPEDIRTPGQIQHRTLFHLMAMDGSYDNNGRFSSDTLTYVSNHYIVQLARFLNDELAVSGSLNRNRFVPVGSVNPERSDWKSQLTYLGKSGVYWIKWRPSSMDFDPETVPEEFYLTLVKYGIGILSHTGTSSAIRLTEVKNGYAAPRKLRKALKHGVRVVMLHMGRIGTETQPDLYFNQFRNMLLDRQYDGLLFGEFSAFPYGKSIDRLDDIFFFPEGRIVNGSDYPAVTPYIFVKASLRKLSERGFLSQNEVASLYEIYRHNPLLFDFVLKRTIRFQGLQLSKQSFLEIAP